MAAPGLPPMTVGSGSAPVIPEILIEHLLELAFLAIQRRAMTFAPDVSQREFQRNAERSLAHWDGLVLGAGASARLAAGRLAEFDPWEAAVAVRTWIELGTPEAGEIVDVLAAADDEQLGGWRQGLRSVPARRLSELFPPTQPAAGPPAVQSALAYAWGWHGVLVPNAGDMAFHSEPLVRWGIARLLGWIDPGGLAPRLLAGLLSDPEPAVRRAALWSEVLLDPVAALERARADIRQGGADPFVARIVGILGSPADMGLLIEASAAAHFTAEAARALGDLGNPAAVPHLIDLLGAEEPMIASAAEAALVAMLGRVPSAGSGPTPADDGDDDEPAAPTAEEARAAWQVEEPGYRGAGCWLGGRPFPWAGAADEEPMAMVWRTAIRVARPGFEAVRKEVPDGFFAATATAASTPGD